MSRYPARYLLMCMVAGLLVVATTIVVGSFREIAFARHANNLFNTSVDARPFKLSLDAVARRSEGTANAIATDIIADTRYTAEVRAECFFWLMQNKVHKEMAFTSMLELPWFDSHWISEGGCSVGIGLQPDPWNDPTVGPCFCYPKVDFLPSKGLECTLRVYPASCAQLRKLLAGDEGANDELPVPRVTTVYLATGN